jgi:acyl carrier protein
VIVEKTSDSTELRAQIAAVFTQALKIDVPSHDTDLLATGLLDSLGFVELMLQLEQLFGLHIAMEDFEPDDFRSIAKIAAFVAAQRGAT